MPNMYALRIVLSLALVLAVAGCEVFDRAAAPPMRAPALEAYAWRVIELVDQGTLPAPEGRPTLEWHRASGSAVGHAGVNQFTGAYYLNGETLYITDIAATRMAGRPERMELERRYLDALQRIDTWRIDDNDHLELQAGDSVLIRFERMGLVASR